MMPGVSGLDAIRVIRADPALADLPVILLTARAQESDVETGFDSGADDYITKPFSPRELATRVRGAACPAPQLTGGPDYRLCHPGWNTSVLVPVHASSQVAASDPAT